MFVGTKLDQENNRKVSIKEVAEFCKEVGACYKTETSAKKSIGVEEVSLLRINVALRKCWQHSAIQVEVK